MTESEENIINNNDNILRTPDLNFEPQGGLGYEYFRMMKFHSDKIAQYNGNTGESETYADLLKKCIKTSIKLRSENIKTSDIICLCTYNHMNAVVPFISAAFLGVKVASFDPSLSFEDTAHLLKQVKPAIIFLVPESLDLIEKSMEQSKVESKLVIFGVSQQYLQFSDFLEADVDEESFRPVNLAPEETQIIFFSSGTTGLPKGICQNGLALMSQAINFINNGYLNGPLLYYSSLYWISAALTLTALIFAGQSRVVVTSFNATRIWQLIEEFKLYFIFLAPIQAIEMTRAGRPENLDTSNLMAVLTGGGALTKSQMEALKDLLPGTSVTQAYGQTEVAGVLTCFANNDVKDNLLGHFKPTSCGRPIRGITYKVVNPESDVNVGVNQEGEMRVKSRFIMNGYYNLDSSESFDSDGWLRTGDIVYYDEDFCFYVVDRIKELLKYKSWHVAPVGIENVLKEHPAVDKVVVIGVADEVDGDHPMAIVIKKKGFEDVSREEIEEFGNERLTERQKIRAGVVFVDSFPITPSGKIKRQLLKKMVIKNL